MVLPLLLRLGYLGANDSKLNSACLLVLALTIIGPTVATKLQLKFTAALALASSWNSINAQLRVGDVHNYIVSNSCIKYYFVGNREALTDLMGPNLQKISCSWSREIFCSYLVA